MSSGSSRYISKDVSRRLRDDARDRCCVCGRLIPFDEISDEITAEILHQHHVICFSEGGPNTEENLMLVDPSCHAKIHSHPDRFPIDVLKEAKRHWIQMKQLVSSSLLFEPDQGDFPDGELARLKFYVAAVNLDFELRVPASVTVLELARFISMWIMHPLVTYARIAPFNYMFGQAQLARMGLARKTSPRERLNPSVRVDSLELDSEDALVALVDFEWVAARPCDPEEDEDEYERDTLKARFTLKWGASPRDLDLHLIPADDRAVHVFYGNRGALNHDPWARLNIDIREGFGPEVISIGPNATGQFCVAVHNYSHDSPLFESRATVSVELPNGSHIFHCPRRGSGTLWKVCLFDASTGAVEPIDRITDESLPERGPRMRELRRHEPSGSTARRFTFAKCPNCNMVLSQSERQMPNCPVCGARFE